MNFLTEQERDQLKHQHKQAKDKRVCDRIKTILLMIKNGQHNELQRRYLSRIKPFVSRMSISLVLVLSPRAVEPKMDKLRASSSVKFLR